MLRSLTDRLLVCFTLAFMAGLVLAANGLLLVAILPVTATVITLAITRRRAWVGALLLGLAALAGGLLYQLDQQPNPNSVSVLPEGGQTLTGLVASAPAYRDGVWHFLLAVASHEEGRTSQPLGGKCYVKLRSPRHVQRGQRWQLTGRLQLLSEARNPGGRSHTNWLASTGADGLLIADDSLAEPLRSGDLGWLDRHAFAAQQAALRALQSQVGEPYPELTAAVADSVIFGVHAAPPPQEIADAFRRAGTMHLLVVSGSMVSLVFGMVFLPGLMIRRAERWWWIRRGADLPSSGRGRIRTRPGPLATLVAAAAIVYYAILTEGGQAVWRAAVIGLLVSLAFLLRRIPAVARRHSLTPDRFTLLAAAALVLLSLQPAGLFSPGFQLTFAAVLGLLFLLPLVQPILSPLSYRVAQPALGTFAAQAALFPVMMWHFGTAPIGGLVANLLAVPLAALIVVSGLLTCLLHPLLPTVAALPGWVTGWSTRALILTSTTTASLPWSSPEVGKPAPWIIAAWYAILIALGLLLSHRRRSLAPGP